MNIGLMKNRFQGRSGMKYVKTIVLLMSIGGLGCLNTKSVDPEFELTALDIIVPEPTAKEPTAKEPTAKEPTAEEINMVLSDVHGSLEQRILMISEKFLHKPYELGVCGEGRVGDFSQKPLTTFTKFDCVTFIEAVLALAHVQEREDQEKAAAEFMEHLKSIKYFDGNPSFVTRKHFSELDWFPDNEKCGYVRDITQELYPDSVHATALINKRRWFELKSKKDVAGYSLTSLTDEERERRVQKLQAKAGLLPDEQQEVAITYIPIEQCFNHNFQKNFPRVSIFGIIRNNHVTIDGQEGSEIYSQDAPFMSHVGFIIRTDDGQLWVRHAPASARMVIDMPFDTYMKERMLNVIRSSTGARKTESTVVGLSIYAVL
jgi:hypothetical protein